MFNVRPKQLSLSGGLKTFHTDWKEIANIIFCKQKGGKDSKINFID